MFADEGFPLASKIDRNAGIRRDRRYFDLHKAAVLAKDKKIGASIRFPPADCATIR
jgi:hypothetical protein